jgi:hypothetical protein
MPDRVASLNLDREMGKTKRFQERPPVAGGPGYVFGFKAFRRLWVMGLWLVDDGGKGAGQFGGANSLTHGDE